MKRRIVFSNYDDLGNPFYAGGGAAAIHEIARRLTTRYDVSVLTGKYPGSRNELVDAVRYERIGVQGAGPRLGQLLFHFALPATAFRRQFDVWVESLTPPFSTACLQLFTKRPVALLTQNLIGKAMARKYKLPFHWGERLGLKTYNYGIALSAALRAELLAANPRMKIAVIPNGVDPALINQPVRNRGEHILFLGRIDIQQKGLDLLLAAFHRVSAQCGVPLAIAGAGIDQDELWLKQRIQELGLRNRVKLLGKLSGEQKADAFRHASFLAMPSRYEGFPLTLLEAFCWELPVVLFAVPELAWLPDTCCSKIIPFEVPAFADAMMRLANDEARRQAMGRAGKLWVRAFSWDTLAESYDKFFASMLAA